MVFVNNIDPVFLNLGPFEIRYYGLVYALGFLLAYLFLRDRIKKKILKIEYADLDNYLLFLIIGVVFFARVFEIIFFSWNYYIANPVEMLLIWHGGLSFHGGLIGAILVTYFFAKKHKIDFYDIADSLVIPAALALALGRIANFINSEHYGKIVDAAKTPWCVVYQAVDSYCRHPSQLYESLKNFLIFGILLIYDNARSQKKDYKKGTLFWMFVLMYGILRFLVNFYRDDVLYWGISMGQWLSFAMVIVAAFFLWKINKK
ncbi:MAG: prolipoprotein diacylglyceryl transferase [Candidatus Woesearchaeota archaeon]